MKVQMEVSLVCFHVWLPFYYITFNTFFSPCSADD